MGSGYQISQSLIAIGSGGLWGKGLGFGVQKLGFLPQPIADSIFSVFAEETGFIGSIILIFLFLLFAIIGFKISKNSPNTFLKTLSLGIVFWIVFQAFVNIGSVMGIVPLTGIPLPFIANGGSHLLAELAGAGLLLNISKYSVE
jgi:cell division protein FtsW